MDEISAEALALALLTAEVDNFWAKTPIEADCLTAFDMGKCVKHINSFQGLFINYMTPFRKTLDPPSTMPLLQSHLSPL